jgi:hypothetical protein
MIPLAIVLVICEFQAIHLIKTNHPNTYKKMGATNLFGNKSVESGIKKFLYKREYKKLNDKNLILLCDSILILQFIFLILLLVFMYMMIDSAF